MPFGRGLSGGSDEANQQCERRFLKTAKRWRGCVAMQWVGGDRPSQGPLAAIRTEVPDSLGIARSGRSHSEARSERKRAGPACADRGPVHTPAAYGRRILMNPRVETRVQHFLGASL